MSREAIKRVRRAITGVFIGFIQQMPMFLLFAIIGFSLSLHAQGVAQTRDDNGISEIVPGLHSGVWFFIFVGWFIFSALTSGMPEPTKESSPWYIWAYRSFHILAASGTSFFQNKIHWPDANQFELPEKK